MRPSPTRTARRGAPHAPANGAAIHAHRMSLHPHAGGSPAEKLDRLLAFARGHRRALVLTHDNPDPDSLASGVALAWLLGELAGVEAKVAYGGIVGRAENRALIHELKLPVVPVSRVVFDDFDMICMVDTQPEQGNHSLPSRHFPDVVIDHHPVRPDSTLAAIADVGGPIGATSTVVVEYLRASKLEVPPAIATALFYGIKADTRDLGRQTTPQDVEAYLWLFPRVDKDAMGRIEHPPLSLEYFALSRTAIDRAEVHGHSVVLPLGELYAPDMVAEVAERFLYLEGMRWSIAFGTFEGDLYYSIPHHRPALQRRQADPRRHRAARRLGGRPRQHGRRPAPGARAQAGGAAAALRRGGPRLPGGLRREAAPGAEDPRARHGRPAASRPGSGRGRSPYPRVAPNRPRTTAAMASGVPTAGS